MAPVASTEDGTYGAYSPPQSLAASAPAPAGVPPPFLVREQDRDGNCLFRAFSDQVYGTPEHHRLLRERCSKYIALERDYFQQFVAEPFDEFLSRMRGDGEWGDDVEIEALSEMYDCRVEIYAAYSHKRLRTFHEACDASRTHPIMLQYEGQAHYNSLAPRSGLVPVAGPPCAPGEIEDAAIAGARRRIEAGTRRGGASEADMERTERELIGESVRLSRQEFEHKSQSEMDRALQDSRQEWDRQERKRMDDEVVDAILQQSVMEEEQKQLNLAMKESKEVNMIQPIAAASSSSGNGPGNSDSQDFQYPESVYAVMSMGFPLEKCIQAYHLVGDSPEGILAFCCQTLGR